MLTELPESETPDDATDPTWYLLGGPWVLSTVLITEFQVLLSRDT